MGQVFSNKSTVIDNSSIIESDNSEPKIITLHLIGDLGEGKSSLLLRYVDDTYTENFISSIGTDFKIRSIFIDNKEYKLKIFDISDQDRVGTTATSTYRKIDGIIIVCSIIHKTFMENIKQCLLEVDHYFKQTKEIPVIVVGSKCDLQEQRTINPNDIREYVEQIGIDYIETSAKDNVNIDLLFERLVCKIENIPLLNTSRAKSARK